MKPEYQDRIDDYLQGLMSEEERRAFEKEVETDAELRDQLEYSKNVKRLMVSRNEKLTLMKEWGEEYEKKKSKGNASRRRLAYWISGIAAVFIAGLLVLNINTNKSSIDFGNIPYPSEYEAARGSGFNKVNLMLKDKQFESAMEEIISVEQKIDTALKYCDTISDQGERDYEKESLKQDADEIRWLKVYALYGLGQKEEAVELLNEMRNADGMFQHIADSVYQIMR